LTGLETTLRPTGAMRDEGSDESSIEGLSKVSESD
jgi:hypothetical protein